MQKIDNFVARGFIQSSIASKSSGAAKEPSTLAIKSLEVGKQITGLIVAKEDSGQLQIKFTEFNLSVKLPAGLEIGQRVTVQVLTGGGNPTVKLLAVSSETPPVLSESGKNISVFLQENAKAGIATTIQGASPILTEAAKTANGPELAGRLEHAITKSGIFYESHLKQWVNGNRSIADISKEPQALHAQVNVLNASNSETSQGQRLAETLTTIVNTQLHTLDTGAVTWQGEVWPKQEMTWQVSKYAEGEASIDDASERSWSTMIRLDLPNIGPVCARISLYKGTASIKLEVDDEASAVLMQHETSKLGTALIEAGLTPTQIKVGKNGV